MEKSGFSCPGCGSNRTRDFFSVKKVPVHSILLVRSKEEALKFPTGDIHLCFCRDCGFVFNRTFDASLQHYSENCEETQGYSGTFNFFHRKLALMLVDRFNLREKTVLEIGCGKGEFLLMLCQLGDNRGIGFDPAYRDDRLTIPPGMDFRVYREFYPETYTLEPPDFICCKMTLEHVPDVLVILQQLRASLGERNDVAVFFQVPEARRVFGDIAFWDIYYEHCSYFSKGSLGRLFRRAGFSVENLWTDYDDQYLMIEARPAKEIVAPAHPGEEPVAKMEQTIQSFEAKVHGERQKWNAWLKAGREAGAKTILWGGGSKAVAFLSLLDDGEFIDYVVDINPHRQGTFLAGSGKEIVAPSFLQEYRPQQVVIMNAIYFEEISNSLQKLGLSPQIATVGPRK